MIVLEQFKNSIPQSTAVYISDQKVKTATEAAALADDYVLTHQSCVHFPCLMCLFSVLQEDLKVEQQADPSLRGLFEQVLPTEEVKNNSQGYCMHNALLVRKWVPQ